MSWAASTHSHISIRSRCRLFISMPAWHAWPPSSFYILPTHQIHNHFHLPYIPFLAHHFLYFIPTKHIFSHYHTFISHLPHNWPTFGRQWREFDRSYGASAWLWQRLWLHRRWVPGNHVSLGVRLGHGRSGFLKPEDASSSGKRFREEVIDGRTSTMKNAFHGQLIQVIIIAAPHPLAFRPRPWARRGQATFARNPKHAHILFYPPRSIVLTNYFLF